MLYCKGNYFKSRNLIVQKCLLNFNENFERVTCQEFSFTITSAFLGMF